MHLPVGGGSFYLHGSREAGRKLQVRGEGGGVVGGFGGGFKTDGGADEGDVTLGSGGLAGEEVREGEGGEVVVPEGLGVGAGLAC